MAFPSHGSALKLKNVLLFLASIGITVFTGMIASTCLAVLFVPSFFVVIQRFEEWRLARKRRPAESVPAE